MTRPSKRSKATEAGEKLLRGRFEGKVHPALDRINRSLDVDRRMWREDVRGSIAHAEMLGAQGILKGAQVRRIVRGLKAVAKELEADTFPFEAGDEDIHMAVERRLTELIGADGARLHVARSRNDQVATDLRLYLHGVMARVDQACRGLMSVLAAHAHEQAESLVPFYTHLQRAQPVVLGHALLAYVEMLARDLEALDVAVDACPLGAGAGAGTTFAIDRSHTAKALGFKRPTRNSLASVSSRQDVTQVTFGLAALATTLSRLGGDLVLWTSREFGFARLSDSVSTGSSIMPQKRNPDGAELLRAKATRVQGALGRLLEVQRGLPLGYFKDLQEDKAALFEAEDSVQEMLAVARAMFENVTFDVERMEAAVADPSGFLLATEIADWLVVRGVPFREAHEAVGQLVSVAETKGVGLEDLDDAELRHAHRKLTGEVREVLDVAVAVRRRKVVGGPAPANVRRNAKRWLRQLAED